MATMDGKHMTKDQVRSTEEAFSTARALDLALEALELNNSEWKSLADSGDAGFWSAEEQEHYKQTEAAITAIKQVRALDKKAENARELGLDYEPAEVLGHNGWGFPIKAAAPVQKKCDCAAHSAADCVCGAWDKSAAAPVQEDWGPGPHECHSLTAAPVQEPVTTLFGSLPVYDTPPVQEPVACDGDFPEGFDASFGIPAQALRQANAALCEVTNNRMWDVPALAERMMRFRPHTTPPAQPAPVQEPVNRYCCHACFTASGSILLDRMILCPQCGNKRCPKASDHRLDCTSSNDPGQPGSLYTIPTVAPVQEPVAWRYRGILHEFDPSDWAEGPVTPLYTTPPNVATPLAAQRQSARSAWVGLTDDEINALDYSGTRIEFVRAIEAKLKEKNT